MGSKIKLYTRNILETSSFIVSKDADTGYPDSRLHDREISLYWQDVSESIVNFVADQGATTIKSIDTLIIDGHNWSGSDIAWQYSDDGVTYYDAVPVWSQTDNLRIIKTLSTPLTHRYWRILLGNVVLTSTTTTTSSSTTSSTASTVSTTSSTTTTTTTTV